MVTLDKAINETTFVLTSCEIGFQNFCEANAMYMEHFYSGDIVFNKYLLLSESDPSLQYRPNLRSYLSTHACFLAELDDVRTSIRCKLNKTFGDLWMSNCVKCLVDFMANLYMLYIAVKDNVQK